MRAIEMKLQQFVDQMFINLTNFEQEYEEEFGESEIEYDELFDKFLNYIQYQPINQRGTSLD